LSFEIGSRADIERKLVPECPVDWRARLIRERSGGDPRACLANAVIALRGECPQGFVFDEFSFQTLLRGKPPWESLEGKCTDHHVRVIADWLQHQKIMISVEVAGQAIEMVAHDEVINPPREYLHKLKWDGSRRLDSLMSLYFGAEPSEYAAAVGARWMRSAVARIERPGCKADCALIVEGEQGIRKSTAFKVLADPWYTDDISELGSKDAAMQIARGAWVIEAAELDGMNKVEHNRLKASMSRGTDRYRPPYGRHVIDAPRQCVFVGTVNHSDYLRDPTGGRRFWPVKCTRVRVEELARDRDQLWAEALASYRAGEAWWLDTPELNQLAEQEQAERYEGDPWDALILAFLAERVKGGFESVSTAEILDLCLHKKTGEWTKADEMRVSRCLQHAKWRKYRDWKLNNERRYRPPLPT
jgi:predicted P-loop ATPase